MVWYYFDLDVFLFVCYEVVFLFVECDVEVVVYWFNCFEMIFG